MTEELLNKYLQGLCTEEEVRAVEQWLHNSAPGEMDEVLLGIWNGKYPAMSKELTHNLWSGLRSATGLERQSGTEFGARGEMGAEAGGHGEIVVEIGVRGAVESVPGVRGEPGRREKVSLRGRVVALGRSLLHGRSMAAASVFVLLAMGLLWLHRKPEAVLSGTASTKEKSSKEDNGIAVWASVINTGVSDKKVELKDGTEVVLGRGARLRYIAGFEKDRRSIYLEGRGLFKVARDEQRPFTVYSGDIATTALGTVFRVAMDSGSKNISVHLYQGRVVVHSWRSSPVAWADIFLSPGEEMLYDSRNLTASVGHSSDHTHEMLVGRNRKADNGELRFSNAPLSEVFETLMMHYHQKIDYRKADIVHMDFTGSLSGKDSLSIILTAIANMNKLRMVQQDEIFVIRKSPR